MATVTWPTPFVRPMVTEVARVPSITSISAVLKAKFPAPPDTPTVRASVSGCSTTAPVMAISSATLPKFTVSAVSVKPPPVIVAVSVRANAPVPTSRVTTPAPLAEIASSISRLPAVSVTLISPFPLAVEIPVRPPSTAPPTSTVWVDSINTPPP